MEGGVVGDGGEEEQARVVAGELATSCCFAHVRN